MPFIGNQPADKFLTLEKQVFTTSATDTYTLDREVSSVNDIELFLNNVRQEPTEAYTISGTTLTLASAITASDSMYCIYQGRAVGTQSPATGSVTGAMMSYPLTNFSSTGIDDNATSTEITIESGGDIGIGTTNPDGSDFGSGTGILHLKDMGSNNTGIKIEDGTTKYVAIVNGGGDAYTGTWSNNNYRFYTNSTERMRINNTGLVGINTSSPNRQFNVYSTGIPVAKFERNQGDNNNRTHIEFIREGSSVGEIQCTNTSTSYATSSDYRLKENVVDITGATERLKQLQPKRFNFIANADNTVDGFLAHEVSDIVPEAITGTKDEVDADGNPVYQGIDQSKLVPLLTASLKEAIAKIEELETRIATLEGN